MIIITTLTRFLGDWNNLHRLLIQEYQNYNIDPISRGLKLPFLTLQNFLWDYNIDPISRGLKLHMWFWLILSSHYNIDPISRGLKPLLYRCFLNIFNYNIDPISRGLKLHAHQLKLESYYITTLTRFLGDWNLKPNFTISIPVYYNIDPISRGLKQKTTTRHLSSLNYNIDPISRGLKQCIDAFIN